MNIIQVNGDIMYPYKQIYPIPKGQVQFSRIKFNLSEDWEGRDIIVQFVQKGKTPINSPLEPDGTCFVPDSVGLGLMSVYLRGYKGDGTSIATANGVFIPIVQGAFDGGEPEVPPSPDLYSKLIAKVQMGADAAKASAETAKTEAENAQVQAKQAVASAEQAVEAAKQSEKAQAASEQFSKDSYVARQGAVEALSNAQAASSEAEQSAREAAESAAVYDDVVADVNQLKQKIADLPQPDWNQNDDTQPDYVKNRPFWDGGTEENLLLDETEITFDEYGGAQLSAPLQFIEGDTYIVTYNRVVYECVAYRENQGSLILGNGTLAGVGGGNGEPFLIADGEFVFSTDASALIKIVEIHREIHKIDEDYLPSTIPFVVNGKIPTYYVQQQFPIIGDVFGSVITNYTSTQSTRKNPYPNKKELKNLTIETFNAMLDGNKPLPDGVLMVSTIASVVPDLLNRRIEVNWHDVKMYSSPQYPIAGVKIEVYEALIHEDTNKPGTIVSEYAYIKITDKALS